MYLDFHLPIDHSMDVLRATRCFDGCPRILHFCHPSNNKRKPLHLQKALRIRDAAGDLSETFAGMLACVMFFLQVTKEA